MQNVDQSILLFFANHRIEWLSFLMVIITYFGNYFFTLAVTAISSVCLVIRHHHKKALALLIAFLGSSLTIFIVKNIFDRPRPENWAFYIENSPAFPSSHAAAAIVLYGFLIFITNQTAPKIRQKITKGILILLIILIGLSRIYLGVHYLSDILVGYLIGFIWLYFAQQISRSKTWQSRE